tara:strand:- start:562 stop:927 length:366 start_codon:yes stop_codon:yes gene_type:complete
MKRAGFKMRSGNSPLKTWGALWQAAKYGTKKLANYYAKATVPMIAADVALDDRKNMSTAEKALSSADDFITGGLGKAYLNRNGKATYGPYKGDNATTKPSSSKPRNGRKNGAHLYSKKSLK